MINMRSPRHFLTWMQAHLMVASALGVPGTASAQTPTWQLMSQGFNTSRVELVAVSPLQARLLYAASGSVVYASHDGGAQWRAVFRAPGSAQVTRLAINPFDGRHVLAATMDGLYGSFDDGEHWQRLFRQPGSGESQTRVVVFHPARRDEVFLGTAGGLFRSTDGARHWQQISGRLRHRSVQDIAADPINPQRVYVLTDQGMFVSASNLETWERIALVSGAEEPPEETEALGDAQNDEQEAGGSAPLTTLAINPTHPEQLYVGSRNGLYVSQDHGTTWQHVTQSGIGTEPIRQVILHAHSPLKAYVATAQGVARYDPQENQWEALYDGLPTQEVHGLAATGTKVFAATDRGLYMLDLTEEHVAEGDWPRAQEILGNFVHEPTIKQVQETAIAYAEVHPDKIKRWRRQAYLQALVPTFSVSANTDLGDFRHWDDKGVNGQDVLLKGERDIDWSTSVSWDLGELIWNDDQTSIDTRSRLMVQLRDDILDEVTRAYFERRRLQIELLTDPPSNPRAQLTKELRLQELTAILDGLTGGWFSKQLEWRAL